MLDIKKINNSVVVVSDDNIFYPNDNTNSYPLNSLMVVVDESNMAIFKSAANGDVLFSALIEDLTINGSKTSKDTIFNDLDGVISAPQGGGGGGGTVDAYTKAESDAKYGTKAEQESLRGDVENALGEIAALGYDKQDKLTAGDGITIEDNVISAVVNSSKYVYNKKLLYHYNEPNDYSKFTVVTDFSELKKGDIIISTFNGYDDTARLFEEISNDFFPINKYSVTDINEYLISVKYEKTTTFSGMYENQSPNTQLPLNDFVFRYFEQELNIVQKTTGITSNGKEILYTDKTGFSVTLEQLKRIDNGVYYIIDFNEYIRNNKFPDGKFLYNRYLYFGANERYNDNPFRSLNNVSEGWFVSNSRFGYYKEEIETESTSLNDVWNFEIKIKKDGIVGSFDFAPEKYIYAMNAGTNDACLVFPSFDDVEVPEFIEESGLLYSDYNKKYEIGYLSLTNNGGNLYEYVKYPSFVSKRKFIKGFNGKPKDKHFRFEILDHFIPYTNEDKGDFEILSFNIDNDRKGIFLQYDYFNLSEYFSDYNVFIDEKEYDNGSIDLSNYPTKQEVNQTYLQKTGEYVKSVTANGGSINFEKGNGTPDVVNFKTINNQSIIGMDNIKVPTDTDIESKVNDVLREQLWQNDDALAVTQIGFWEDENRMIWTKSTLDGTNPQSDSQYFKTINGQSILGQGDIVVSGGGSIDMSDYYTKQQVDNLIPKIWSGTQSEYDRLATHYEDTLYLIKEEEDNGGYL